VFILRLLLVHGGGGRWVGDAVRKRRKRHCDGRAS
jgi:hypothetical protein